MPKVRLAAALAVALIAVAASATSASAAVISDRDSKVNIKPVPAR